MGQSGGAVAARDFGRIGGTKSATKVTMFSMVVVRLLRS